jgi:DNA-binding PadR family transcriptional regulator
MVKKKKIRTELEGAILGVLSRRDNVTAYMVRKEFLQSPSAEWSGSAGSVYPAIKRLAEAGCIRAINVARGHHLELTTDGKNELTAWIENAQRAAGPGMDPFRTRAGHLLKLPKAKRERFATELRREIAIQRAQIESLLAISDPVDRVALELALDLHGVRLKWLDKLG